MSSQDILLPPAYRLVTLREVGDAFAHAKANAVSEGAGTLVFVGRFDLVEFAVVLEPDEPLREARRAFYAGMTALMDALAVNAPPEKPMNIDWPDTIRVDAGLVGGGRLAWPDNANENEPPEWLVFGAMIRTVSMLEGEAGLRPLSSALDEEGFSDVTAGELVEAFSRHFMSAIDTWQEQGFATIAREYLSYLPPEKGVRRDIDENGDLLIRRMGKTDVERRALLPILQTPSWYDPKAGGPRS
jgi:biotin-(acetyl-CoA carboxylase) ligase